MKMKTAKPFRIWLSSAPGLAVVSLFAVICLSEWFSIGVLAHPETIADYHFGSEAMMYHGGWEYRTAGTYATVNLVEGVVAVSIAALFLLPVLRRSWSWLLLPYSALVSLLLVHGFIL